MRLIILYVFVVLVAGFFSMAQPRADEVILSKHREHHKAVEAATNALLPCAETSYKRGRKTYWFVVKDGDKIYLRYDNEVAPGKPIQFVCVKPVAATPPVDEPPPDTEPPPQPIEPPSDNDIVVLEAGSVRVSWVASEPAPFGYVLNYFNLDKKAELIQLDFSPDTVSYRTPQLPPGKYRFDVFTKNQYRVYSTARLSIVVELI